ncbi:MAG: beta-galactosidase, partial [Bacteroidales bacterium]|nr:beta-galactosidase [Bacteroidales bacterium]
PKSVSETHNDLTIGCETLDRDYADYHQYKEYLGKLGIRKIRLQAGWAKTEKEKGVYDFAWLDSIIDDAVSRGLEPWLETSYGNPIYEGGGTTILGAGFPSSEEALTAWDNWVRAMAVRYKGKVHEWEIWNEPDRYFATQADEFADFTIRTAKVIKSVDPDAKIAALALAGWRPNNFQKIITQLRDKGGLDLFYWLSYHFYNYRPEDMYKKQVEPLQDSLNKYSTKILIRQGETGAPSKGHMGGALSKYDWSEISQGKWALRRMLGDKARNIPTTIFQISDMNYSSEDAIKKKNVKGLLETDDDNHVVRPKQSYFAVHNLVAVWDLLEKIAGNVSVTVGAKGSFSTYAYETGNGSHAVVVWDDGRPPVDAVTVSPILVTVQNGRFQKPVCVDIRTGNVYKISYKKNGSDWTFTVPVYDSPMLIIDRKCLTFK